MDVPIQSSKPGANVRARVSVVVGALAVAEAPAWVYAADRLARLSLIGACVGIAATGILLGLPAILLGRRARGDWERTLGRVGGLGVARAGRVLGLLGFLLGVTAALALGFYGLLTLYAK